MVIGEKMKTYARIVEGVVVDVTVGDLSERFHPDLVVQFVEVPAGTVNGATFLNGKFTNSAPEAE